MIPNRTPNIIFMGMIIDGTTKWLFEIESIRYICNEFKINKINIDRIEPKQPWIIPSIKKGNLIKLFVDPKSCNI